MPSCESCGASIELRETECPYCGHNLIKKVERVSTIREAGQTYRVDRDSGTVHFGDGVQGARPITGKDNVSATYRSGSGTMGNLVCTKCKHQNPVNLLRCEACGSELQRRKLNRHG